MTRRAPRLGLVVGATALGLSAGVARASPGLYVVNGDAAARTHASTVVLMREGNHTVLSMQSDYDGPPEDFAVIVPLPRGAVASDVRALDPSLFTRLERLTGPRLEERWEADPCPAPSYGGSWGSAAPTAEPRVHIETELQTGEYDVVVLGAEDSRSIEGWLRAHDYRVPEGTSASLAPYVASEMNFLVARVDADRLRFEGGRALLSPLRVHFESPELSLPLRLGPFDATDGEDLVVIVIARNQRYEAASHPNVFVPTNLDVAGRVRDELGAFYETLLERALEEHPGAVITEHSWPAAGCDPCPTDARLDAEMLSMLGGDVLYAGGVQPGSPYAGGPRVRMDPPTASAGLSAEVVRRVMRRHINELRFCYEQNLFSTPSAGGVVEARIDVLATGAVHDATMTPAAGAALSERTLSCLSSAPRRWTFPEPSNHGAVHITTTLTFGDPRATHEGGAPIAYESELVATRLRVRPGHDTGDLVLRPADPVAGGREQRDDDGRLEEGARPATTNGFQARYVIRHPWQGAIACEQPRRDDWSGRPLGADPDGPPSLPPVVAPAHARATTQDAVALDEVVLEAAPGPHTVTSTPAPPPSSNDTEERGCAVSRATSPRRATGLAIAIVLAIAARRRRVVRPAKPAGDA